MATRVICPQCKAKLKFEANLAGRACACPKCKKRFRLNEASDDSSAPQSPIQGAQQRTRDSRNSATAPEPLRRQRLEAPSSESKSGIELTLPQWNVPGWAIYGGAASVIGLVLTLLVWLATGRSSKPEIQANRFGSAVVEPSAEPPEQPASIVPETRTRQPAPIKPQNLPPVAKRDPIAERAGVEQGDGQPSAESPHPNPSAAARDSRPSPNTKADLNTNGRPERTTPAQSSAEIDRLSDILPGQIDESVAAIVEDFDQRVAEFTAEKLRTTDNAKFRMLLSRDPAKSFGSKLLERGEKEPKSTTGFQAFVAALYVVRKSDPELIGDIVARACKDLLADHIRDPGLGKVALLAARLPHPAARHFLEAVADKSPQREIRGLACYALLANLAHERDTLIDRRAKSKIDNQIAALSRRIDRQEFSDVSIDDQPLAEAAKSLMDQVGQKGKCTSGSMAPEIVGRDLEGARLRLSDYRGKVVILEFWASWCPYCRKLFPYERDLVKKMRGRPFVLLGVNLDKKANAGAIGRKRLVSWRSFQDGPGGPISARWGVTGIPHIFILDHKGTIRFSGNLADASYYTKVVEDLLGAPELKRASASGDRDQLSQRSSDRN
jgi:thiol-disulfide isomerase/thioredoxin